MSTHVAKLTGDWKGPLSARLFRHQSVSAALYLEWSCDDLLATGSLEKHSPTVFRHGTTLIVVRHPSGLRKLPHYEKLVYVIDDDWRSGITASNLPRLYRLQNLILFGTWGRWLEEHCDTLLVSSDHLLNSYRDRYPQKTSVLIEPAWPESSSSLPDEIPRRLAYLSAWSHAHDFKLVKPAFEWALARYPDISVTVSSHAKLPKHWATDRRVEQLDAMSWPDYRKWMIGRQFDIAVYPSRSDGFSQARSANKLAEFDQFGAAIIASTSWQPGRNAAEFGRCFAVEASASDWQDALSRILETPSLARDMAKRNRQHFQAIDTVGAQRKLWADVLG